MRARYRRRRDVLISGLATAGWPIPSPPATMFCWAPLPAALRDMGSLAFSKLLLEEAQVAVAPGIGFGEYGEGFVRLGLVENEHRTRQAVRNIRSEEHTSELQSLMRISYAVFCLKKKKNNNHHD